jgi:uncharacterized protein (DUF302 family)
MNDYGRHIVLEFPFERTYSIGRDLRRYVILSAVDIRAAHSALRADLDAGVLLPCNMAVYELADGQTVITVGDPFSAVTGSAAWQHERPDLGEIAASVEDRLAEVLGRVSHQARTAHAPAGR